MRGSSSLASQLRVSAAHARTALEQDARGDPQGAGRSYELAGQALDAASPLEPSFERRARMRERATLYAQRSSELRRRGSGSSRGGGASAYSSPYAGASPYGGTPPPHRFHPSASPAASSSPYVGLEASSSRQRRSKLVAQQLKDQGNAALTRGAFDDAIECYTRAIEVDPAAADVHVFYSNRSATFLKKGLQTGEREAVRRALADADLCCRLAPQWHKGHSRRAAALHHQGNLIAAADAYRAGLALDPTNASCRDGLAAVERLVLQQRAERDTAEGSHAARGGGATAASSDGAPAAPRPPPGFAATRPHISRRQSTQSLAVLDSLEVFAAQQLTQREVLDTVRHAFEESAGKDGDGEALPFELGGSLKTRVRSVISELDKLQLKGIDAILTGSLGTGQDKARSLRKQLTQDVRTTIEDAKQLHKEIADAMKAGSRRALDEGGASAPAPSPALSQPQQEQVAAAAMERAAAVMEHAAAQRENERLRAELARERAAAKREKEEAAAMERVRAQERERAERMRAEAEAERERERENEVRALRERARQAEESRAEARAANEAAERATRADQMRREAAQRKEANERLANDAAQREEAFARTQTQRAQSEAQREYEEALRAAQTREREAPSAARPYAAATPSAPPMQAVPGEWGGWTEYIAPVGRAFYHNRCVPSSLPFRSLCVSFLPVPSRNATTLSLSLTHTLHHVSRPIRHRRRASFTCRRVTNEKTWTPPDAWIIARALPPPQQQQQQRAPLPAPMYERTAGRRTSSGGTTYERTTTRRTGPGGGVSRSTSTRTARRTGGGGVGGTGSRTTTSNSSSSYGSNYRRPNSSWK